MSDKKKKPGFKEPPFFKPSDMYFFDKGTNARINQLLKADKDRTKPKVPPAYSMPNKILQNKLFAPLFNYYLGFGLEDVPPPPYGSAPADPHPAVNPGQTPEESMKTKGQDIKRHMSYLEKKLVEATNKRMQYYEELQAALTKAKKLDKKSGPLPKITADLDACKAQVQSQDKQAKRSVFAFGDMTLPVMRVVIVLDGSAGSKASLAEIKEELLQFIEGEVTEQGISLGVVYLNGKEASAFKPYLIKEWNVETIAALKKWLKNVKTTAHPAGQAKLAAALDLALEQMDPSVVLIATSHGAVKDESDDAQRLMEILATRCPPGSNLLLSDNDDDETDDEEDEEAMRRQVEEEEREIAIAEGRAVPSATTLQPSVDVTHTTHGTSGADASGATEATDPDAPPPPPPVCARVDATPTEKALMDRMGVDVRVLRLECKLTGEDAEAEDRAIDAHLMRLIEASLGEQASEEDVELGYSKLERGALWKGVVSTVKKTTKLRKKQAQLSTIHGDAQTNAKSINPIRLNLHGQLAVERMIQFDIERCQAAMWQPTVEPAPAPEKGAKGKAGKRDASPKRAKSPAASKKDGNDKQSPPPSAGAAGAAADF